MLQVENLRFRRKNTGTYRLSLTAKPGIATLISGASGIGKTSFLEALAGFLTIDSGRVCWDNRDFTHLAPEARPLSMLLQGDNLFPHLSLLENVALAANPGWRIPPDVRTIAHAMLERVGVAGQANARPDQVSGGQAQRAGLARALLRHRIRPRPLLLLDEPYSALDDATAEVLHHRLLALCAEDNLCVLLVAHRVMPADRCVRMERVDQEVAFVSD